MLAQTEAHLPQPATRMSGNGAAVGPETRMEKVLHYPADVDTTIGKRLPTRTDNLCFPLAIRFMDAAGIRVLPKIVVRIEVTRFQQSSSLRVQNHFLKRRGSVLHSKLASY